MKVLVVGGGGREHALAWKAAQSPLVERVYVAPGNPGTAAEPGVKNVDIGAGDVPALAAFAARERVDLTIVGPEAPLVAGIVDTFEAAGLRCFGPRREAARLEGSKVFAKDFLARHDIPTARYQCFTELEPALAYLERQELPVVVKADGLAAGKGVVIARERGEAERALRDMLAEDTFGAAGRKVVIEDCLEGEEVSFTVLADGRNVMQLATSQDHKARDEGDRGPNTGGMGAYSPAPVVTPEIQARIMREVIDPTVAGMAAEGCPYVGFLYAGLMIAPDGTPAVLEFNCRFGDPETQPILMRLESDLVALCQAALDGKLAASSVSWDPRAALGVVMAAGGYPGNYRKGDVIVGPLAAGERDRKVFHAGTRQHGDTVVTAGGRVLCVVALGANVSTAADRAYDLVGRIGWEDVYFRRDIGHRARAREAVPEEL